MDSVARGHLFVWPALVWWELLTATILFVPAYPMGFLDGIPADHLLDFVATIAAAGFIVSRDFSNVSRRQGACLLALLVLCAGLRVSSLSAFREEPIDWDFARAVGCGVLSPVSGGGLLSGVATGIKLASEAQGIPAPKVWGCEPELSADAKESFDTKTLVEWPAAKTTALRSTSALTANRKIIPPPSTPPGTAQAGMAVSQTSFPNRARFGKRNSLNLNKNFPSRV